MTAAAEVTFESLLDFLKRTRGFDFSAYKRSSLERRIRKRMEDVGVESYGEYLDFLEVHQDEFSQLFNTILINVTAFFRDAPTWEFLREDVLPDMVASRPPDAPLRVWCAGCASGEEAYTVAMLLVDILGEDSYRNRVKIYATDVDDEALQSARAATYNAKQVEAIPREFLDRYFERADSRYVFRQDLRRSVIFGRNDLVQDAPISRVDLLVCRNTLMYFNAEAQGHILRRFHFALDDAGVLVLGKSEMLLTHGDVFTPVDLKRRIFRKVVSGATRHRLDFVAEHDHDGALAGNASLRDRAFEAAPVAQIVLDRDNGLVAANHAARQLFTLSLTDLGRPVQDLELSYKPVELRTHLDRVRSERRATQVDGVRWADAPAGVSTFDVLLTPLTAGEELGGTSVSYVDVTQPSLLQDDLQRSKHDLEQAYEELQSTVEELETTNEELQSTNEELETTNEELQSTNEELETMNEELQSTNEELETINNELRTRTLELDEANAFLETILASMGVAVAVLDASQCVRVWNRHAEDLWGVRVDEAIGQHFLSLDIGLPVEELRSCVRSTIAEGERCEQTLPATNRRGRAITCRVVCLPLVVGAGRPSGAVILMSDADSDAANDVA